MALKNKRAADNDGLKKRAKKTNATTVAAAAAATDAEADAADEPLACFKRWCVDRSVVFHPSLELRNVAADDSSNTNSTNTAAAATTPRHNAVFAAAPVAPGDVLCTIPKAWCLTTRTGSIVTVLPQYAMDNLDEAGLILAVMVGLYKLNSADPYNIIHRVSYHGVKASRDEILKNLREPAWCRSAS
jgi:hypothetical protein